MSLTFFCIMIIWQKFTNRHSVTITMHRILNRTVLCIRRESVCFQSASPSSESMTHGVNLPHTCLVSLKIPTSQLEALSCCLLFRWLLLRDCLLAECGHLGEMMYLGSVLTPRCGLKTGSFLNKWINCTSSSKWDLCRPSTGLQSRMSSGFQILWGAARICDLSGKTFFLL